MNDRISKLQAKAAALQARIRAERAAERERRKRAVLAAAVKAGAAEIEADPSIIAEAVERALRQLRSQQPGADSVSGVERGE